MNKANEIGERDGDQMVELEDELSIGDLLQGGAKFTLRSNFQEFDEDDDDAFPELATGDEGIILEGENITSPWEREFKDLIPTMTDIGNGIYKKCVKKSVDNTKFEGNCRVAITYASYFEKQTIAFDSSFMRGDLKVFVTDNEEVLPGLELAVKSMKIGEESQFIIPYTLLFGELGCPPRIKPKADALYVIKLVKFSEVGDGDATEKVSEQDKRKYEVMIDKILAVKTSGIDHFKQGSWTRAAASFQKAITRLESCQLKNEEEEKEQRQHLIKLYTDIMICFNKMNKEKQVCSAFNDLSRLTNVSRNPKALYQHGKALMALGELDRAKDALKKASLLKPMDADITNLLKTLDEKHQAHKLNENNMWRQAMRNPDPYVLEKSTEVNEHLKETVNKLILEFQNDDTKSKMILPDGLSQSEIAAVDELIKDMEITLKMSDFTGKKKCYLAKNMKKTNAG